MIIQLIQRMGAVQSSLPQLPSKMTILDVSNKNSSNLGFQIQPNHPVTKIFASNNHIQHFPLSLDNLQTIVIESNNLNKIFEKYPSIQFNFPNLIELNIARNLLIQVPDAVFLFPNLENLDLSINSLTTIDSSKLTFPKLSFLNISRNSLTSIPDVSSLPSLSLLNCRLNEITDCSIHQ